MPMDTFIVLVGVYESVGDAETDYALIKELHTKANLIDAYDAAVIERKADGKVKIVKKHETPTRAGGVLGGGVGLATGLVVALFPFAAIGGGLLAATTGGGALLGVVAGHAAAGMSRDDLKETWRAARRPTGGPGRSRCFRYASEDRTGHEASEEGRHQTVAGRPERDRSRRAKLSGLTSATLLAAIPTRHHETE
jgi:uncharacterized membrane protein